MRQTINIYIFITIFFVIILLFLSVLSIFPSGFIAKMADIFENESANFIFITSIAFLISLLITKPAFRSFQKILGKRQKTSRLGKILVSEGLINEAQLDDALNEQTLRVGEILTRAGRLTIKQLKHALDLQKESPKRVGEILRQIGYSTEEDIYWALNQAKRRLGQILLDKGIISFNQLQYALSVQQQLAIQ
jgi:hypothetical protein